MFTPLEIALYALGALVALWILADALVMEEEDLNDGK